MIAPASNSSIIGGSRKVGDISQVARRAAEIEELKNWSSKNYERGRSTSDN
jgi:hypothetical protein